MKSLVIEVFLSKTYGMWRGQHEPGFLSCAVGGDGGSAGAALDIEAEGRRAREVTRIPLSVVTKLEDRIFLAVQSDGETFIVNAEFGMRCLDLGGKKISGQKAASGPVHGKLRWFTEIIDSVEASGELGESAATGAWLSAP